MPASASWRQMLIRHVVLPMPGSPTIMRCGLARIETRQETSSFPPAAVPSTMSTGPSIAAALPGADRPSWRGSRSIDGRRRTALGQCDLSCTLLFRALLLRLRRRCSECNLVDLRCGRRSIRRGGALLGQERGAEQPQPRRFAARRHREAPDDRRDARGQKT